MTFGGPHCRIYCGLIRTVRGTGNKALTEENGVAEMTAVVSRERARTTCLTGAAGVLMIAIAVVMMVVASPGQGPSLARGLGQPATARIATDVCHRFTSRSDSATVRACPSGPSAAGAWADPF
jgi:hypothetical protein